MTFSVHKGEFVAIVGESGSGKSTLLNIVGALDKATSGKVFLDGQDIFSMPEKKQTVFRRQHIGFIFQSFNLIPELNVEQNIIFPLLLDYKQPDSKFVEQLGLSVGDMVTVTVPDGSQKEYHITGVLENMGSLLKADVYGMVLSEDGFREIADEAAKDGTMFRIQFKSGVNIQSAIRQIKETYGLRDDQVAENTALLGLMGQSENSTMHSLYPVCQKQRNC